MKRILQFAITVLLSFTVIHCKKKPVDNDNWISIFNGINLENWTVKIKGHPYGENWNNTFMVIDSAIRVDYSNYEQFDDAFGHIFYKTPYSDYKLKLKYRFLGEQIKGGQQWALRNSGVMIHSEDPKFMGVDQDFPVSIEVQLLGGIDKSEKRSTANLCTPGTHVSINNERHTEHCIDSNSDTYYGDQWVTLEIEVRNDSLIRHYINGKKVMQYSHPVIGGEFNTLTQREGEALKKGYISLQSESHPVEFKEIFLLNLSH